MPRLGRGLPQAPILITGAPSEGVSVTLSPVTETDAPQPLSVTKFVTLTAVTENDTAQTVGAIKTATLAWVVETDAAQPLDFLVLTAIKRPTRATVTGDTRTATVSVPQRRATVV